MITPEILNLTGNSLTISNAEGCAVPIYISELYRHRRQQLLVICRDHAGANHLIDDLKFLLPSELVLNFSDYETLPYDSFSPQQDLISNRMEALFTMLHTPACIVVSSINTLMQRIAPREYIEKNVFILNRGQEISMTEIIGTLNHNGYSRVSQVYEQGEFAVRGSIIDLFPTGTNNPYRIDFFDNEIESIRIFNTETQRTGEEVKHIRLLPAREFPIQKTDIELFRQNYRENFSASLDPSSVYQQVSSGHIPAGIEYYLPLFYQKTDSILDYLQKDSRIVLVHGVSEQACSFMEYVKQRYEAGNPEDSDFNAQERPKLKPLQLYFAPEEFFRQLKNFCQIKLLAGESEHGFSLGTCRPDDVGISSTGRKLAKLENFIKNSNLRILFSAYSPGRVDTVCELLRDINVRPKQVSSIDEFTKSDEQYGIIVTSFDEGLIFTERNIAVITESELFGNTYIATKRNNKNVQADAIIRNLAELKTGEKIVHYKYGIGCYRGLEIRDINGINKEFFCLEYADNARLYVEITELHLISRYTGGANPPLNKLGSDTWVKNREKAQKKVKDVAVQLLDVYSKRATRKGFRFKFDKTAYNSFVADFPYVETEDQKKAILSVITDMTQAKTMDRLICGDVGFGKTEVAIRAAFIAVSNSKQVAVLVPTVLLAEQHYDTFKNRFSNEAVTIESLSRFKTAGQQTRILEDLAEGKIDIIIGTHKLLSKTVNYKDLGLLIVDEEHRFGVKQKEMIKAMRSDVDILTLTATPIPRTLNMAFSGLRDLSLITTPPAKRLAIKTFLKQMDFSIIREAVARELKRGGQVYYIHNEVSTIEHRAEELRNLLPEARIEVAHGQMNERMLGLIMNNFYRHKFDILVCTTIIETGIDIPSANTMIIERADKFGLAQLHQIRGRVGRSCHQAYAYLLTPPPKLMSRDAVKRLEAITMHEDLGVGFALANHDLEIRGAGELLGDEQSGQIAAVGFTLYMEMLNKAINSLKDGDELSLTDLSARNTEINLDISALIPATYIDDVSTRLIFYKRLVSAANDEELQSIKAEMIDRFGLIPQELSDLFEIHKLRIKVEPLGIDSIAMNNVTRFIKFNTRNKINPDRIVKLLMKYPKDYALEGLKLRIIPKVEPLEQIKFINDVISNIV